MQKKLQHWQFTITFKLNITCVQKYKLIEKIKDVFRNCLNYRQNKTIELYYTIEYHKMKRQPYVGMNDTTAPHVHGYIELDRISKATAEIIYDQFKKYYGRSQFYLAEFELAQQSWVEYINKDVQDNNLKYNTEHSFYLDLKKEGPTSNNLWETEFDIEDII